MVNREQMKKNQENEYKQQMQLTPEQNKELKEMCEAAVAVNGEPEINGLMAFEEYLKLFKIIVTLQCRYTIQNSEANKAARRAAMAQSDNNAFIQVTKKQLDQTNKTKNGVHLGVLEFFKIEPHLYDRTGEAVCENEEYDRRATETMTKLEIAEHKRIVAQDESYTELDRATVLKHLDKLEEKKA